MSTTGTIYNHVFFYFVSLQDTDQHWTSKKVERAPRPCPWRECRSGFIEHENKCYNYDTNYWEFSSPDYIKRKCWKLDPQAQNSGGFCKIFRERLCGKWKNWKCERNASRRGGCPCHVMNRSCPNDTYFEGDTCVYNSNKYPLYRRSEGQIQLNSAACVDNMYSTSTSDCGQGDFYCRNEYYHIGNDSCRCANTVGNVNCNSGTALQCAIFDRDKLLKDIGPTDFITSSDYKLVNTDQDATVNKLYRVKINLSKLTSQNIATTYTNLVKYFVTDQSAKLNEEYTIQYTHYPGNFQSAVIRKYKIFPKQYNQRSLDMVRWWAFYNISLSETLLNSTFRPDTTKVLVFFALTTNSTYKQTTDIVKTSGGSYDISGLDNKANPLPFFWGTSYDDLKWVRPVLNHIDLSLSTPVTNQSTGYTTVLSDVIFLRLLGGETNEQLKTKWPESFTYDTNKAVYSGFINFETLIFSREETASPQFEVAYFKQRFIDEQTDLPNEYKNWNRNVYYNIILPKFCVRRVRNNVNQLCPVTTNYFGTTTQHDCTYMTANYCSGTTAASCDCNLYCNTRNGLNSLQQPQNSWRTKAKMDGEFENLCTLKCSGCSSFASCSCIGCPLDCQCYMRNCTDVFKSSNSVVNFSGPAGCWFKPCMETNTSQYYIPGEFMNLSCPQTICTNFLNSTNSSITNYSSVDLSSKCGVTSAPTTIGPSPPIIPPPSVLPPAVSPGPSPPVAPQEETEEPTEEPIITEYELGESKVNVNYLIFLFIFVIVILILLLFIGRELYKIYGNEQQQQQQQQS
jgi:hypothetical protein